MKCHKSPLKNVALTYPPEQGRFSAIRRFDIHTGIDLYCPEGTEVLALEDGRVVKVEIFTGPKVGSGWWHETWVVMVEGKSGVIAYGEISPTVQEGQQIKEGDIVGKVMTVLKKDKGLPMTMLHLELYQAGTTETMGWELNQDKPEALLDPTGLVFGVN